MQPSTVTRLLAILLLLATPAEAGPINWARHHKRFLLAAGAVAGASVIQWKGTSYCQRGAVERCTEGYGSRRAFNGFLIGVDGAMLGAAEACWKNQGGKFCYALVYGVPATQTALGIKDFTSYQPKPKGETDEKAIRRSVARARTF